MHGVHFFTDDLFCMTDTFPRWRSWLAISPRKPRFAILAVGEDAPAIPPCAAREKISCNSLWPVRASNLAFRSGKARVLVIRGSDLRYLTVTWVVCKTFFYTRHQRGDFLSVGLSCLTKGVRRCGERSAAADAFTSG
jgi:hypothetical protein